MLEDPVECGAFLAGRTGDEAGLGSWRGIIDDPGLEGVVDLITEIALWATSLGILTTKN